MPLLDLAKCIFENKNMNKTISLALVFSSCCFIPFNPLFLKIHAGHEDNLWGGEEIEKEKDDNSDLGVIHYCNYHNYFIENSSNFGNNADTQATCGYVSLAMLLNYYDCYLNDSIVPEQFEVLGNSYVSPGTLYESNSGLPLNSVSQYYNYLRSNYVNSSLHAYLILLDKNALSSNPNNMASTYIEEFGTSESSLATLASNYLFNQSLSSYCTIVCKNSNDPGETKSSVISAIEDELAYGYPVVCGFSGHARVLFGFDDEHNFESHEGYTYDLFDSHAIGSDGMPYLNGTSIGFLSLHFSLSHSHSYNYYDSTNNYYYCRCGSIFHTTHTYTYHYEYQSSNYHRSYCVCGDFILEKHSYRINIHYTPCVCGGSVWD